MPPKARRVEPYRICEICGLRASRKNNEKRPFMACFPLNEDRCRQWVKAAGKEDLIYVPIEKLHVLKRVCGNHFESKAFNKKKTRLQRSAIPTLNLNNVLPDEMLREFPCHVHSTNHVFKARRINYTKATQSKIEALTGPIIFVNYKCMHSFPNPKKKPDLHAAWLSAIGERFQGRNLTNKRICDHHFAPSQKQSTKGLVLGAVPVYLDRKGSAEKGERLQKEEPHSDHTYVVTQKIKTAPYGDQVTPVYANPKAKLTQIKPPTEIDLVPELSEETHTLVVDGVLPYNVPDDELTADDVAADDIAADDVPDHGQSPVPEVEDPAEKSLFSWQKTELIEADDPDEPPPRPPSPPADPTLALYCDPDPTVDQAVPSQPAPAEKEVENRCKDCAEVNEGFEFWCVQCSGGALCGACAGRAPHHAHHVLRAPMGSNRTQTQAVLVVIRQQLQNENLLSPHETADDGVKVEVKEEPAEAPPPEAEPPAEPDPLACEPRAAPEPEPAARGHRRIAGQIVDHHKPLKLPQLPGAHARKESLPAVLSTQRKLVQVSLAEVKGVFRTQLERIVTTQQHKGPQAMSQAYKENLVTQPSTVREDQGTKTSQTAESSRHNQARTETPVKVTSEPQQSETVIIDLDEDETVEYLEEGLESDIETVEEVALDDNDTNDEDDDRETNEDDDRETNEDDDRETNEDDDRETNEDDDRETNEDDDRETNEDDDRETNEDDDRETNEDNDGLDDRDDDVLDEDYLVNEDDLSEDDESDEDRIGSVAVKGVQRKVDAKQTLPMRGPSKSIIREDDLIEDDLSDEDPIVSVAGRGVKRKEDAEETSPVRGPLDSMARALPSKAVVQVRPLSSLEIRDWTADRKRLRKY